MKAENWYPVAWMPVYDPDKGKLLIQAMKVIRQGQLDYMMIAGESEENFARAFCCYTPRTPTMWSMDTNHCSKQALLGDQQVRNIQNMQKKC